jgi:anti-sigma factor RsiW
LTCRELIDFLMAYIDGELPAEERKRFDAHLLVCASCTAYLRTYEATMRLERKVVGDCEPPEELVRAVLASRRM